MKNFGQRDDNRGRFKSEGRNFGRSKFRSKGRHDRGPATMYRATCAECGKDCEVPFRPSGEKPVYCSECFENKRDGGDRAPRRDFSRPNFSQDNFNKNRDSRGSNEEIKRLLEKIINKLDQLIRSFERSTEIKTENDLKPVDEKVTVKESASLKKQTAVKKTKKISKTS
jgi:CxxC-x17-CxxC domain-containing protein